jgi:hypothetical protein
MKPAVVFVLAALSTLLVPQGVAAATYTGSRRAQAAPIAERIRLEDERLRLEDQHTRLDDARLHREAGSDAELQGWVPFGTLCLGLVAAVIGFGRYFHERKRTRALEVAQGVSENLVRIVEYRSGPSAIARVVAALRNLDALIAAGDAGATATARREGVTDTLDAIARDELVELATPTDARLPVVLLDEWPPFRERVRSDEGLRDLVISRYAATLSAFAGRHAVYVSSVRREGQRLLADDELTGEESLLFAAAVEGYVRYAELISNAGARRRVADELCSALNDNRQLTDQLFGAPLAPTARQPAD